MMLINRLYNLSFVYVHPAFEDFSILPDILKRARMKGRVTLIVTPTRHLDQNSAKIINKTMESNYVWNTRTIADDICKLRFSLTCDTLLAKEATIYSFVLFSKNVDNRTMNEIVEIFQEIGQVEKVIT